MIGTTQATASNAPTPFSPEADNYVSLLGRALRADLPSLSDEAVRRVRREVVVRRFPTKATIIHQGQRPRIVFVVAQGWVRECYTLRSGQSRNVRFVLPGRVCGMQRLDASLIAGTPTTILSMTYRRFCAITASTDEWQAYEQRLLKRLLSESQGREHALLSLDAQSRYESLLEEEPDLEDIVPQKEIASYLGITPVHLSRIRRSLR